MDGFLKRRMLTEAGWVYFCTSCGEYKLEKEFYKSKTNPFGLTYKCRVHYQKDDIVNDPSTNYLKLNPLSDKDFQETELILTNMGFKFGPDELPVWKQFNIKHNLK